MHERHAHKQIGPLYDFRLAVEFVRIFTVSAPPAIAFASAPASSFRDCAAVGVVPAHAVHAGPAGRAVAPAAANAATPGAAPQMHTENFSRLQTQNHKPR